MRLLLMPIRITAQSRPLSTSERLRRDTSIEHTAIERVPMLAMIFDAGFTLRAYHELLRRLYAFYLPMEDQLFECAPPLLDAALAHRRKTPLLERDLAALNEGRMPAVDPAAIDELPLLPTAAHALGALYVLEGATLGGQIIRRRLREQLGSGVDHALAFYTGHAAATGAQWRSFRKLLDERISPESEGAQAAAAGANATFAAMRLWLMKSSDGCDQSLALATCERRF